MAEWYVDKGLATLVTQLKKRFPGIVIGTIGDPAHSSRDSDHNPEEDGSVDAADPMLGKSFTEKDAEWLWNTLRRYRDKRIAYIIWNRQIVSSTVQPWVVRKYTGSDPHTGHLHISVNDKHETDGSEWKLEEEKSMAAVEMSTVITLSPDACDALGKPVGTTASFQTILNYLLIHTARVSRNTQWAPGATIEDLPDAVDAAGASATAARDEIRALTSDPSDGGNTPQQNSLKAALGL